MNMKLKKIKRIIVPSKKINYFVFSILVFGIISGCIFLTILSKTDKDLVVSNINEFINVIKNNNLNFIDTFKNSFITNLIYIILLFVLGMTIIGIIFNIFIIYIKGFTIGFTISSIIYTFKVKGILLSGIYIIPSQLINILMILLLGIYSIMFSLHLIKQIKKPKVGTNYFKKYIVIFVFCLLLALLSSLSDTFIFPNGISLFV